MIENKNKNKINSKKYILAIFITILSVQLFGQTDNTKQNCASQFDTVSNRTIYILVDTMPEFPGGIDSLKKFIQTNLRFPQDDGASFSGTVYISVIVETDGSLTNKKVYKGIYKPADNEALIVIDKMPKWKTGKCNGIKVPVKCYIPIRFITY